MKIKNLLAVVLGTVMIGAVCMLAVYTGQKQESTRMDYARTQLQNATRYITLKVNQELTGNMKAMESVAELLAKEEADRWRNKFQDALSSVSDQLNITRLLLCDTVGSGYDLPGKRRNISFCKYYQRALLGDGSMAFSTFYEDSTAFDLIFNVPISQDGKVAGVLRAALDLEHLQNSMLIDTFRGKEEVYLLNKEGKILTQSTKQRGNTTDFYSLFAAEEETDVLEQEIKQGKELIREAKFENGTYYICYLGLKSIGDGGIMVVIPKEQLLGMYDTGIVWLNPLSLAMITLIVLSGVGLLLLTILEIKGRYKIERLAYYDEITEGINYNRFCMELPTLLHKANGSNYAVVVIAIDRFDYIKEFFGIEEGHRILRFISQIIKENIKSEELFSRLNADNIVLLIQYHNKEELSNRITYLDVKMGNFEEKNMKKEKYELQLHYGIYCVEEKGIDIDMMVSRATQALYLIKNDRKQIYEYYSGAMQSRMIDEKEIEDHMYRALEDKEFLVYLQPKYDLRTGLQVGAEALVRWMHPDKGLMYPGRFIGVFEKNGFIVKLDMYILEELCHRLKIWISKGYRPMPLSINISRLNLYDDNFVDNIEAILEKYGIPANLLQLEIAEEVVSDNMERLISLMERLKKYGFLISMDDFGTGTTSMNTLYHVPIDELKLDRKFLLGAEKTDRGQNVIKSIIEMAKNLDIKVVSEGVENKAQARMLLDLGCDMIQGYVFCDPLPIREYEVYAYGPRANENKIW